MSFPGICDKLRERTLEVSLGKMQVPRRVKKRIYKEDDPC